MADCGASWFSSFNEFTFTGPVKHFGKHKGRLVPVGKDLIDLGDDAVPVPVPQVGAFIERVEEQEMIGSLKHLL